MKNEVLATFLVWISVTAGCERSSSSSQPSPQSTPTPTPTPGPDLQSRKLLRHNLWTSSLARGADAPCSVYYDFRRDETFDFHVMCLPKSGRTIQIETYEYLVKEDSGHGQATLRKSSCSDAPASFAYDFGITPATKDRPTLLAFASGGQKLSLRMMPEDELVGDLRTATSLYGRTVERGCFSPTASDLKTAEVKP